MRTAKRTYVTTEELAQAILARIQNSARPHPEAPGVYCSVEADRTRLLLNFAQVQEMDRVPAALKFQFEEAWTALLAWRYVTTNAEIFHSPSREHVLLTELGKSQDTTQCIPGISRGDEFVQYVEAATGPLDAVVKQYLAESWDSVCNRQWLSSAFMLGAASERLLEMLAENVETKLGVVRPGKAQRFVKELNNWLISRVPDLKARYPGNLVFHDLDSVLNSIFQNYRLTRNAVGHPRSTAVIVDVELQTHGLLAFKPYARIIYEVLKLA